jgi:RNA polymerase sigma-70 factor (ECF subfamily)
MIVLKTSEKIKLDHLSDEELLSHVGSNRREVLNLLYDRYAKRIYYKSMSLLKNRDDALDLTHDIFIKIFTSLEQFKGRSKFSLWVHSISYNTCLKYLKDKKRILLSEMYEDDEERISMSESHDHSEKMLLELKLQSIELGLGFLRESERNILLMKYMDNLSVKEISKITGLQESSTKMRLKRSREKLLHWYSNHIP